MSKTQHGPCPHRANLLSGETNDNCDQLWIDGHVILGEEIAGGIDPGRKGKDFGFGKCHFEPRVSHLLAV